MAGFGLLGEKLSHSYSPAVHAEFADYEYRLYEKSPEELAAFLQNGDWQGLNVTIPYKKTVIPYCGALSETARRIGSVNTLCRRADGTIYGDNTDAYGFESMIEAAGVSVSGKKAIVLGSGGASNTAVAVLSQLGAAEVTVISRSGQDNYTNLNRHADAQIVVNTTPVGMYPENGKAPLDLRAFPKCEGVLDVIYNPHRTALLLQAEELGIPCAGGLRMLVAQAKRSCELFLDAPLADSVIEAAERKLLCGMRNIVLIGMPGCGKSTVAALLSEKLGRPVFDADAEIEREAGMTIPEIFAREGEDSFRTRETAALAALGKKSGAILATGGGAVLRRENYPLLHQNGLIVYLTRELSKLAKDGRPLSQKNSAEALYAERAAKYEAFADVTVSNDGSADDTAKRILEVI